jgi:hypothetical protein
MRRLHLAAAIGVLLFSSVACTKSPQSKLVGVWKESTPSETVLLTFRADGTFVMTLARGASSTDLFGNWTFDATKISIQYSTGDGPLDFDLLSLSDDALNLRLNGGNGTLLTLSRQSSQTVPPSEAELFAVSPEGRRETIVQRVDKPILNNARHLSGAATQYFIDNGKSTVSISDLIGPLNYVRELNLVGKETYPNAFTQGVALTINGVAGVRTITYAP